jgi:hypothetical protein
MINCGDLKKDSTTVSFESFFPETFSQTNLYRADSIRIFVGDSLWEYINGGAEFYHLHDFVSVATTTYKNKDIEVVADIYKFADSLKAYGLYSMFPRTDADIINLGVEGFITTANINFVKGEYLVKLIGYDESSESDAAMINLAEELNKLMPGITSKPEIFGHFPPEGKIKASDKYYVQQFLGQKFLADIYSTDYFLNGDTITLFISDDQTGAKYMAWNSYADNTNMIAKAPEAIEFDENSGFILGDSYQGDILAGLKNGRLIGIVNYTPNQQDMFIEWINGLL